MSKYAIQCNNLSKKYHIGGLETGNTTLMQDIVQGLTGPFRRTMKLLRGQATGAAELDETFWALKDVSFEINHGEVVGFIGHNGAGKSTLLKILSRITEPTNGQIKLYGRVGSLLEVGTGFHVELTGRENIYMNGAILGMSNTEIKSKFDDIVEFSGVGRFIDTPVKHYSSGMHIRLGFAVAAHLEPDILIVDEVLSVGDAAFQQKCLGKMGEVAREGRTVLFVSHNMGAISNLCERVMLLNSGQILMDGKPEEVIPHYLSAHTEATGKAVLNLGDPETAIIEEAGIMRPDGEFTTELEVDRDYHIWIKYTIYQQIPDGQVALAVVSASNGSVIFVTAHTDTGSIEDAVLQPGTYISKVKIPGNFLNHGSYLVNLRIIGTVGSDIRKTQASAMQALQFRIHETGSVATRLNDRRGGYVLTNLDWEIHPTE